MLEHAHQQARARWLEDGEAELLQALYFHVVFTLPDELAPLALQNPRAIYGLLFRAASCTLSQIARDPKHLGAEIGFLAVLHTWGQKLGLHPHVHCLVPGGGISPGGSRWISCRKGFFLPVKVLSRRFRNLFLQMLRKAFDKGKLSFHGKLSHLARQGRWQEFLRPLQQREWVVYAKPPFQAPGEYSSTWPATPTGWPSPIGACSASIKAGSPSAARTTEQGAGAP